MHGAAGQSGSTCNHQLPKRCRQTKQAIGVGNGNGILQRIPIRVAPTDQSNRVALQVSTQIAVVVATIVMVNACNVVIDLPRESQRNHGTRRPDRTFAECIGPVAPRRCAALVGANPRRAEMIRMEVGQLRADVDTAGAVTLLNLRNRDIVQPYPVPLDDMTGR